MTPSHLLTGPQTTIRRLPQRRLAILAVVAALACAAAAAAAADPPKPQVDPSAAAASDRKLLLNAVVTVRAGRPLSQADRAGAIRIAAGTSPLRAAAAALLVETGGAGPAIDAAIARLAAARNNAAYADGPPDGPTPSLQAQQQTIDRYGRDIRAWTTDIAADLTRWARLREMLEGQVATARKIFSTGGDRDPSARAGLVERLAQLRAQTAVDRLPRFTLSTSEERAAVAFAKPVAAKGGKGDLAATGPLIAEPSDHGLPSELIRYARQELRAYRTVAEDAPAAIRAAAPHAAPATAQALNWIGRLRVFAKEIRDDGARQRYVAALDALENSFTATPP